MKNKDKNISTFFLIISILFLFYTIYKSEYVWSGNKIEYYFQYYIFSIILIIFSILSYLIKKIFKVYLLIISISLFFGLYLFEGYLVFFKKSLNETMYYKNDIGEKYDSRSRLEVFKDLKKNDIDNAIAIYPTGYLNKINESIIPLSGISNIKTILCNENGEYSMYKSDRYGFNNNDLEWDKNQIEYLLIGDPYTHGACVKREENIGGQLKIISKKNILNLGYGGNGPLLELATLREYLPQKKVKYVIWLYFEGNDIINLEEELKHPILNKYFKDPNYSQNLVNKQDIIDELSKKRIQSALSKNNTKKIFFKKIKNFLKLSAFRDLVQPTDIESLPEPLVKKEFFDIIGSAKEFIEKNNSKMFFVYLPEPQRYISENFYNPNYLEIKNIIESMDIIFIDPNENFLKDLHNINAIFPLNCLECGHLNKEGYKLLAEDLYKNIN